MDTNLMAELKLKFQQIIDLIALENTVDSQKRLEKLTVEVNDLIDFAKTDKDLQEMSQYQVLINHLQLKIDILKTSLN
ncbi:MAG: hypothetical protein ACI9XR_002079 [Flavobacterium sp.]|jgi:hypothetical protein